MALADLPYEFVDPELLELALTHASLERRADYERLEFLGDAVLDLVVAEALYRAHPSFDEGRMTELKARIVSRAALAEVGRRLDLGRRLKVGAGLAGRALPRSVLAGVYEAVLGAVHLDGGFERARAFAIETLGPSLSAALEEAVGAEDPDPVGRGDHHNPKQALQVLAQSRGGEGPRYVFLEARGPAHARAFRVAVEWGGRRFPSGFGRTRKEAERHAAMEALLRVEPEIWPLAEPPPAGPY